MPAQKNINHTHGFTVIELAIVIVIIGLLMSLAVVNLLNTRVQGRDAERQEDAQTIARHFESLYNNSEQGSETFASYPGINQAVAATGPVREGITRDAFFSPSNAPADSSSYTSLSLVGATNTNESPTGIVPQPPTYDTYVYQPFKRDNTLCQDTSPNPNECVRFNLFYWDESENIVKKITSRNR